MIVDSFKYAPDSTETLKPKLDERLSIYVVPGGNMYN